jgi:uncharacterized protein (AIM24 family)
VKRAQALGAACDGERAVEMVAHGDGQPDTAAAARLRGDLQDSAAEGHGIVARDDALLFGTQNDVEIDVA